MMARGNLGAFWKDENQLSPVDRGFVSVCMLNDGRYHIGTTGCHRVPQGATRCHKVPGGFGFNGRTGAHVRATAGNLACTGRV